VTAQWLQKRIARHNRLHLALGLFMLPAAAVAWVVSFYLLRGMFRLALSPWIDDVAKLSVIANGIAWCGIVLLAGEGLRRTRELFLLTDYADSFQGRLFTDTDSGSAISRRQGNPLGAAYMISHVLLLAPQATRTAVAMLRDRISAEPETLTQAAHILRRLHLHRRWHNVSDFEQQRAAVGLLNRLQLIRVQSDDEQLQIRLRLGELDGTCDG